MLRDHLLPARPIEQLHEMCDAEIVPESGRKAWAALLRQLGGEYVSVAALAHAHEEQCLQLVDHDDDAHDYHDDDDDDD